MLALHFHPTLPPGLDDALARAEADACTVSGAFARAPVRFVRIAADALPGREAGTGVLVACAPASDPVHDAHVRERCWTAVQRFTLSLWSDGLDAVWLPDALPTPDALHRAQLAGWQPVGLVWCPAADATAEAA